ncbi:MAG: ZIP family metal transporter [Flavobacteriaceae bacterium]|nr:ZIP family metal transporter [Flavobacteriaceae bacterium]
MIYLVLILSTVIGSAFIYFLPLKDKYLKILLSFSGAYLLAVTVSHSLPHVYQSNNERIGFFILLGVLLQLALDFFSKGVEHGHIHVHKNDKNMWVLFLSLCVHSFMESLSLSGSQASLDNSFLTAILIHKLPISMILASFMIKSKGLNKTAIIWVLLFAISSPLAVFLGENMSYIIKYKTEIDAVVVGILLHISTIIIFESSENHSFNKLRFSSILIGFALALLM